MVRETESIGIHRDVKRRIEKLVKTKKTPFGNMKLFVDYYLGLALDKEEAKLKK